MAKMKTIDWVAIILLIVGGLNWGLIGLFKFNLVEAIFGSMGMLVRAIYTLVGIGAGYSIYTLLKLK